jgi:hypothetical protein
MCVRLVRLSASPISSSVDHSGCGAAAACETAITHADAARSLPVTSFMLCNHCSDARFHVTKVRVQHSAAVGVAEHGNSAVLITLAPGGEFLDRRRVDLTHGLPTHPYHHEGSWAVGRYLKSGWSRAISLPEAVALVERVREAAARGARECLETLAAAVPVPIASISIRVCPKLPPTTEERIVDARAANVADSIMYREALAAAAEVRGWSVHWYDRERVFHDAAATLDGKDLDAFLLAMGRSIGPPWQAKHKLAAAAALALAPTLRRRT